MGGKGKENREAEDKQQLSQKKKKEREENHGRMMLGELGQKALFCLGLKSSG